MEITVDFTLQGESKQMYFANGTSRNDILNVLRESYSLQNGFLSIGKIAITDSTNIDGKTLKFRDFKGIY